MEYKAFTNQELEVRHFTMLRDEMKASLDRNESIMKRSDKAYHLAAIKYFENAIAKVENADSVETLEATIWNRG